MRDALDMPSENIVGHAVVPVHIGLSVTVQAFIIGEQFAPRALITCKRPVVAVEPAPEHRPAVFVEVLL